MVCFSRFEYEFKWENREEWKNLLCKIFPAVRMVGNVNLDSHQIIHFSCTKNELNALFESLENKDPTMFKIKPIDSSFSKFECQFEWKDRLMWGDLLYKAFPDIEMICDVSFENHPIKISVCCIENEFDVLYESLKIKDPVTIRLVTANSLWVEIPFLNLINLPDWNKTFYEDVKSGDEYTIEKANEAIRDAACWNPQKEVVKTIECPIPFKYLTRIMKEIDSIYQIKGLYYSPSKELLFVWFETGSKITIYPTEIKNNVGFVFDLDEGLSDSNSLPEVMEDFFKWKQEGKFNVDIFKLRFPFA